MSGWMLMGCQGLFFSGLSSAWIGIGLVIGAYFNYLCGGQFIDQEHK